jgi:hypothetical protein
MLVANRSKQEFVIRSAGLLSYQPLKQRRVVVLSRPLELRDEDHLELQSFCAVDGHELHSAVLRDIGVRLRVQFREPLVHTFVQRSKTTGRHLRQRRKESLAVRDGFCI